MAKQETNVPATIDQSKMVAPLNVSNLSEFRAGKGEQILGMEVLDRSDLKMPKIKLMQPTSLEVTKGKCPAGHFYNTITGEHSEKLECVLLVLGKSRVKWKKPFKRGEEPDCRSFDGIYKFDNTKMCKNCADQDWNRLQDGETKPRCTMGYVWLGLTQRSLSPFRLIASGTSVSPTKDFINTIAPNQLPSFVYKLVLTSERQENEQGVFYVIKYNIIGTIGDEPEVMKETYDKYKGMSEGLMTLFMKANEEDIIEDAPEAEPKGGVF